MLISASGRLCVDIMGIEKAELLRGWVRDEFPERERKALGVFFSPELGKNGKGRGTSASE